MNPLLQSLAFLAFFIALYAVPEIPIHGPQRITRVTDTSDVTVVENGKTCREWSAPLFSNQNARRKCS